VGPAWRRGGAAGAGTSTFPGVKPMIFRDPGPLATKFPEEPPSMKTVTVPGGHISPHEAPAETRLAIEQVLKLATLVPNNQMQPTGYAGG